jgi:hypothetical protein
MSSPVCPSLPFPTSASWILPASIAKYEGPRDSKSLKGFHPTNITLISRELVRMGPDNDHVGELEHPWLYRQA